MLVCVHRCINGHAVDRSWIWAKSGALCHHGYPVLTLSAHHSLMDYTCLSVSVFQSIWRRQTGPGQIYKNVCPVILLCLRVPAECISVMHETGVQITFYCGVYLIPQQFEDACLARSQCVSSICMVSCSQPSCCN